jgi:hypothetical protein
MASVEQLLDVIVEPRYDTQTILAAGALQLTYFQVPLGQGASNFAAATVAKQLSDTNMDLAGQLPAGYNFKLLGFRVQPHFNMTAADARLWSSGGWFTFTIASKPYLRTPLDTIPAGSGPFGSGGATADATSRMVAHGWPALSNGYTIGKKPLDLSQSQNFSVVLNWTTLSPVTSTAPGQAAAGLVLRVYLDGYLYRPVQ